MNQKSANNKILPCPGLKITANAGVSWTDRERHVHDLITARMLTIEDVAASPVMAELGFGTVSAVSELMRSGRLYPVYRKNARVVRVFECGLRDFRARYIAGPVAARGQKVA